MIDATITGTGRVSLAFVRWAVERGIHVKTVSHDYCVVEKIPACKVLIHAGARVFAHKSFLEPEPYIGDNIVGTFDMLEYARKFSLKLFVYISTHEAIDPRSPYAATKRCGEILTEAWHQSYHLPYLIVRLPNVFIVDPTDQGYIGGILRGEIKEPRDGNRIRQWMTSEQFSEMLWNLIMSGEYNRTVTLKGIEKSDQEIMWIVKNREPLYERSDSCAVALPRLV